MLSKYCMISLGLVCELVPTRYVGGTPTRTLVPGVEGTTGVGATDLAPTVCDL